MEGRFTPAWVGAIGTLTAAVLVEAVRAGVLPLQAWILPLPALLVGAAAFVFTSLHLDGWPAARAMAARLPGPALAAAWMPWAGYAGWHSATLG
ncbi:MAG TPA: hypothetical protein VHA75_13415, partial [Rugosimonospora sp.]|nr:hypothetical protein [Rugosimonospora sp.]